MFLDKHTLKNEMSLCVRTPNLPKKYTALGKHFTSLKSAISFVKENMNTEFQSIYHSNGKVLARVQKEITLDDVEIFKVLYFYWNY